MTKIKINGWSKFALTIIFTIGFITITVLGVLFNGAEFLQVFPAMCLIETIMVKDLFKTADKEEDK